MERLWFVLSHRRLVRKSHLTQTNSPLPLPIGDLLDNSRSQTQSAAPMNHLDDWEESLEARYPAAKSGKPQEAFRDYRAEARPSVKEFYRLNHRYQTLDFVREKKREYLPLRKRRMSIWEAMEFLNTLVDDSDPDTDLGQIEHLMQTAEAIRADGHPR